MKHALMRAVVVSGLGIGLGFVFYQFSVFTPTMKAFQFTMSSVTIGVAYAALKGHSTRNGLAALFVWYVVLTAGVIRDFNSWLLVLNLAYIGGMAAATYVHQRVLNTRFSTGRIQRIVLAGVTTALANGLIVLFLALFFLQAAIAHAAAIMETVYYNLQLGSLIGLATGSGMEVAEYLQGTFFDHPKDIDRTEAGTDGADAGTDGAEKHGKTE
jgi:hypothetical protein